MGERGIDHAERPTEAEIAADGPAGRRSHRGRRRRLHVVPIAEPRRLRRPAHAVVLGGDAELLGIAEAIGRTGKGVFEINVDTADVEGDLALMRRICEVSGRPLSMGLLQRPGQPRHLPTGPRRIRGGGAARVWRCGVRPQPVPLDCSCRLRGRVNPLAGSPTFQELARRGRPRLELQSPAVRARILGELMGEATRMARFPLAFELGDPPRYDRGRSESLAARAAAAGVDVQRLAYDIIASWRASSTFPCRTTSTATCGRCTRCWCTRARCRASPTAAPTAR